VAVLEEVLRWDSFASGACLPAMLNASGTGQDADGHADNSGFRAADTVGAASQLSKYRSQCNFRRIAVSMAPIDFRLSAGRAFLYSVDTGRTGIFMNALRRAAFVLAVFSACLLRLDLASAPAAASQTTAPLTKLRVRF